MKEKHPIYLMLTALSRWLLQPVPTNYKLADKLRQIGPQDCQEEGAHDVLQIRGMTTS